RREYEDKCKVTLPYIRDEQRHTVSGDVVEEEGETNTEDEADDGDEHALADDDAVKSHRRGADHLHDRVLACPLDRRGVDNETEDGEADDERDSEDDANDGEEITGAFFARTGCELLGRVDGRAGHL